MDAVSFEMIAQIVLTIIAVIGILAALDKFLPTGIKRLEISLPWNFSIKAEFDPEIKLLCDFNYISNKTDGIYSL